MHFFSFFRVITLFFEIKEVIGFFRVCPAGGITNRDYS